MQGIQLSRGARAYTVIYLGVLLAVLQAADGVLTSMGVSRFGLSIEGNPLLRQLMGEFGHVPTLAVLKALAIAVVLFLCVTARRRRIQWVNGALGALNCIYVFAAIVPWTYILFLKPYM